MPARGNQVTKSLHDNLFDASVGQYSNRLYNGTFYHRWAPTIFSPLLSATVPVERVAGMLEMLADPSTFCVSPDGNGTESTVALFRLTANPAGVGTVGDQTTRASDRCLQVGASMQYLCMLIQPPPPNAAAPTL